MSVDMIKLWFKKAKPNPTEKDLNVQLGCHLEEIREMFDCMKGNDEFTDLLVDKCREYIAKLSYHLKSGASVEIFDRKEMLDSLCDQIVTGTGVGYMAGMGIVEGVERVNTSNFTKFDIATGEPLFDANGKIKKGSNYEPPNLDGLY